MTSIFSAYTHEKNKGSSKKEGCTVNSFWIECWYKFKVNLSMLLMRWPRLLWVIFKFKMLAFIWIKF